MKKCLAIIVFVAFICSAMTVLAEPPDKEKIMLRAQALHEKVLRLRLEISISVEEHNKAVKELETIIRILEQMEKETEA